jgi:hypothetical protein
MFGLDGVVLASSFYGVHVPTQYRGLAASLTALVPSNRRSEEEEEEEEYPVMCNNKNATDEVEAARKPLASRKTHPRGY